MPQFHLTKHTFLCPIGEDVIVLDLKNDRYLAFERALLDSIFHDVPGWRTSDSENQHHAETRERDVPALTQLVEGGLLTSDIRYGKSATPIEMEFPSISLIEDYRHERAAIRPVHVLTFLRAAVDAAIRLRFQPLEKIVISTQRAKRHLRSHERSPDLKRMSELAEVFRTLRPLLFGSHGHCLFESLALMRFLLHNGVYANWVFGVHTGPFAAHCWVQQSDILYNDTLDHVRRYVPIMLV